jgi:glycine hydroxymethyltransferase
VLDDPELESLVRQETARYLGAIDLIAASNAPSWPIRASATLGASQFRSAEGLIGRRPYAGTSGFDQIEALASQRGRDLYQAEHCNVQPLSGSMANLAAYKALLKPGDTILSMSLDSGGHLTHGHPRHLVHDLYRIVSYGVDRDTYLLDYDDILAIASREHPQLIIAGCSAYPRAIDFARFAAIGDQVGAHVMADISHISGLVAAGIHENPCSKGLVITSSFEKTLRGGRGGFILCPQRLARAIDGGVFPGLQSSIALSTLVVAARIFREAQEPAFRQYQRDVVSNASHMAYVLMQAGLELLTGGTDTHLILVNVLRSGLTGKEAEQRLEQIGILSNRNAIPYDPLPPFQGSGLRLGTAAVTARGWEATEIDILAAAIADALLAREWSVATRRDLARRVGELAARPRQADTLRDLLEG